MGAFLFGDKLIMRTTKNWGFVNSQAELYMLNHAEHTHQRMRKKKPTGQSLPAVKERTRKKIERKKKRGSQKRKNSRYQALRKQST